MKFDVDTILFDLDGTLVDSVPDLAVALQRTFKEMSLTEPSENDVRLWVGHGADLLVREALAFANGEHPSDALSGRVLRRFLDVYAECCCDTTVTYETVVSTLMTLKERGMKMGVVTNKPTRYLEPMLAHYGLKEFFTFNLAGDSLPEQKPDPTPLLHAAAKLGAAKCLMVGDSISDVKAARAAKMPVVAMSYGYNHGVDIRETNPDVVIDRLEELLPLLA